MKYFNNIHTAEELRATYRDCCKKLHPDTGGSAEQFKEMLNEYEQKRAELNGEPIKTNRARRSELWAVRGRRMIYEYRHTQYIFVLLDPVKGEFLRVFPEDFASVEDVECYDYTETRTQENAEFIRPYSQLFGIGYYWDDNAPLYTEAEIIEFEKRAQNFEHWRNIYEQQEAERERKAKAERFAVYAARCKKWAHLLQVVPEVTAKYSDPERKEQERKAHSVRRANVLAMARAVFPDVKFSLSFSHSWGGGFTLSWTDGPTEDEVQAKCDFDLFASSWDTFDGMTDCAGVESAEFIEFAKNYGNFRGTVKFDRKTSKKVNLQILEAIGKICPEFAEDVKQYKENEGHARRYPSRTMSREQAEQIAKAAGATNWDTMHNGDRWGIFESHELDTFIYMIALRCSFAVVEEEKKPVFIPKHNATYKAVKKAMGAHALGSKTQRGGRWCADNREILNIYRLIDFAPGCGLFFGNTGNYDSENYWYSFYSSSYANDRKRIARYKAVGIEIKATGEILSVSPEIVEGLKADRASVEEQRKAWEKAQSEPKAKKQTNTATTSAKAETVADNGEAPAEGLKLVEIAEGVAVVGDTRTTYANRKQIKAHGAKWNKIAQRWEGTTAEAVESLRQWFGITDDCELWDTDNIREAVNAPLHTAEEITDTAEAVDAEPVAEEEPQEPNDQTTKQPNDQTTAEAVARVALAFVELCQMLQDVAKAQQEEVDRARKAARAQEVQTLRENIATLSAQLAKMSEQLRKMSDRLAELTNDSEPTANDPQTEAEAPQGATATGAQTLHPEESELLRYEFAKASRKAEEATDRNDHTESVIICANALLIRYVSHICEKVAALLDELREIDRKHNKRGHILPEEQKRRSNIQAELIRLTVEEYGEDLAAVLWGAGTVQYYTNKAA